MIFFEDHPPFFYREEGRVTGVFADVANAAAADVGISLDWKEQAFRRTTRALHDRSEAFCSIGHRDRPDLRRDFFVSPPIGTFGRTGFLVRAEQADMVSKLPDAESLFTDTDLIGGFVVDAAYAIPHREYLEKSHDRHLFVTGTHEQLAMLIARERIDFTIENELMAPIHAAQSKDLAELVFVALPGMPLGQTAYIICTRQVPEATMAKFSQAIEIVTKKAAPE